MPLIAVYQTLVGDSEQIQSAFGYEFAPRAESEKFIVAYPEGIDHHWIGCRKMAKTNLETL